MFSSYMFPWGKTVSWLFSLLPPPPNVSVHMLQEYLTIYRPHFTGFGSTGLWRRTGDSGRSERDYPSFWWQKFRRIAFRSDVGRGSKFCWRIQNIDCYTISARQTLTQYLRVLLSYDCFMEPGPGYEVVPVNSKETGTIPASLILKPFWKLTCRSSPVLLNDKVLQHTRVLAMHDSLPPAAGSLASPNHTAGLMGVSFEL